MDTLPTIAPVPPGTHVPGGRRAAFAVAWNLALVLAWLRLFFPTLKWLLATFSDAGSRLHLGLLIAVAGLLLGSAARGTTRPALYAALSQSPVPRKAPLALMALSTLLYLWVEYRLDIDIFSSVLFGLGSFGLLGLYVPPARRKRGLPIALLCIAVLPFGDQADSYFGFGARIVTARGASHILAALGAPVYSAQTILFLENGIAHVDVPCSGIRSLWMGALFFLAVTVLERRRMNGSWLGIGLSFVLMLLAENTVRVAAIVYVVVVLGLRSVADVIHAPLGILGFASCCLVTLLLLRITAAAAREPLSLSRAASPARPFFMLAPALSLFVLALCAFHVRRPMAASAPVQLHLEFPDVFQTAPLPLTPAESDLFRRFAGAIPDKRQFSTGGQRGTLLVAYSSSFRAHHPPELCMAGAGIHVDHSETRGTGDRSFRFAALDNGRRTALYWYQSRARTTDDLLYRVYSELLGRERHWVQVSLVLDEPPEEVAHEGGDLFRLVRGVVGRALDEAGT